MNAHKCNPIASAVLLLGVVPACTQSHAGSERAEKPTAPAAIAGNGALPESEPARPNRAPVVEPASECSSVDATHLARSCDFALAATLQAPACNARVTLDGELLECEHADGWSALDATRIRLSGRACDRALANERPHVRVDIPCRPIID